MVRNGMVILLVGLVATACDPQPQQESVAADTTSTTLTTGMAAMDSTPAMDTGGSQAAQEMETHMKMMEGASGDRLRSMAAMHRQMAADMLAQMNRDMQKMNMSADSKWSALADSVRRDLTHMAEWNAQEMKDSMSGHMGRMRRLMEMHAQMMKNM